MAQGRITSWLQCCCCSRIESPIRALGPHRDMPAPREAKLGVESFREDMDRIGKAGSKPLTGTQDDDGNPPPVKPISAWGGDAPTVDVTRMIVEDLDASQGSMLHESTSSQLELKQTSITRVPTPVVPLHPMMQPRKQLEYHQAHKTIMEDDDD